MVGIITFKEDRIKEATTYEFLVTSCKRGGMKKLMDDKLKRNNYSHSREVETSIFEAKHNKVRISTYVSREVMVRKVKAIKRIIKWNNLIDTTTIKAYLINEHGKKKFYDTWIKIKRGRTSKEEDVKDLVNKKKASSSKVVAPKDKSTSNIR